MPPRTALHLPDELLEEAKAAAAAVAQNGVVDHHDSSPRRMSKNATDRDDLPVGFQPSGGHHHKRREKDKDKVNAGGGLSQAALEWLEVELTAQFRIVNKKLERIIDISSHGHKHHAHARNAAAQRQRARRGSRDDKREDDQPFQEDRAFSPSHGTHTNAGGTLSRAHSDLDVTERRAGSKTGTDRPSFSSNHTVAIHRGVVVEERRASSKTRDGTPNGTNGKSNGYQNGTVKHGKEVDSDELVTLHMAGFMAGGHVPAFRAISEEPGDPGTPGTPGADDPEMQPPVRMHSDNSEITQMTVLEKPEPLPLKEESELKRQSSNSTDRPSNFTHGGSFRKQSCRKSTTIHDRLNELIDFQQRMESERRGAMIDKAWQFLEEPESSIWSSRYANMMQYIIMMSVVLSVLQTAPDLGIEGLGAAAAEICLDVIFVSELFVRWLVSPHKKLFFLTPVNVVDVVVAAALPVRAAAGFVLEGTIDTENIAVLLLLTVFPVFRLMKMLRRFEKFNLLLNAFIIAFEALPVLLFTLTTILLFFSSVIFICEPRDHIDSMATSMWFVIVTMTTVGYGDITPTTTPGHIVIAALTVVSALYMAIPLGIVGNAFNRVWEDRDRLLLVERTRHRLIQRGYKAKDMPTFFQVYATCPPDSDLDEDAEPNLDLQERIVQLFQLFDDDGSGTVEPEEFVHVLFPQAHYQLYALKAIEDEQEHREEAEDENGDTPRRVSLRTRMKMEEERKVKEALDGAEMMSDSISRQNSPDRDDLGR
eukprot:TRINITY_DN40576_c0_g1_i1.p1 TRINITY_DN40576_c0_g1~~TRINITY_DN40576_c0_g1_i1.p1  ORF type:complete len:762 (+),score=172.13 TRINITY_DN40576_c0_g1_i1:167-2452(+)